MTINLHNLLLLKPLIQLFWDYLSSPTAEIGEKIITNTFLEKIIKRPFLYRDKLGLEYLLFPGQNAKAYIDNGGNYEVKETLLCLNIIKPGMRVLDVGANIGLYTLLFAKLVGPTGSVHSFEPEDLNYRRLSANLLLNGFKNVKANKSAVFSNSQTVKLNTFPVSVNSWHTLGSLELPDPWNPGKKMSATGVQVVDGITLDDYCKKEDINQIDFLKIDVEGAELDVLIGAKNLFESGKINSIMFEVSLPQIQGMGHKIDDIYIFFKKYGFSIYKINLDGSLTKSNETKLENYQNFFASKI